MRAVTLPGKRGKRMLSPSFWHQKLPIYCTYLLASPPLTQLGLVQLGSAQPVQHLRATAAVGEVAAAAAAAVGCTLSPWLEPSHQARPEISLDSLRYAHHQGGAAMCSFVVDNKTGYCDWSIWGWSIFCIQSWHDFLLCFHSLLLWTRQPRLSHLRVQHPCKIYQS